MSIQSTDLFSLILAIIGVFLTCIQTVIILLATIFALRQLKESTRSRQADVIDRIFEYTVSKDVREARKRTREIELPSDLSLLTEEQERDIEQTLIGWARVSVLLDLGTFEDESKSLVLQTYSWSIVNSWEKVLRTYVIYQRKISGDPGYWSNVEKLANHAKAWRQEQGLPIWSPDTINTENLSSRKNKRRKEK
jgi:hypothetical protein